MYSAGAIVALPLVPLVTDGLGRRWAIVLGSFLMIIGASLQTASQNCEIATFTCLMAYAIAHLATCSRDVRHCEIYPWFGNSFRHCSCVVSHWRFVRFLLHLSI